MSKEMFPGFEQYANYNNDSKPNLPLKRVEDVEQVDSHHGALSSTFELNDEMIAKVMRLQFFDEETGYAEPLVPEDADFLVPRTGDVVADNKKVLEKLQELAQKEKDTYKLLDSHLPGFIPELKLCVITDSPRRDLEKVLHTGIQEDVLERVPLSERTLLEIWENVGPRNAIGHFGYEEMTALYSDEVFQQTMEAFVPQVKTLLLEKGIALDLGMLTSGIALRKEDNGTRIVNDVEGLLALLGKEDRSLPVVRNVAYKDGKLQYFDLNPLWRPNIPKEEIQHLMNLVGARDINGIRSEMQKTTNPEQLPLLMYLVLLEKMVSLHKE